MMMIQTERLILRRFCAEDLQDLYEYLSDEETVRYEPNKPMDMGETEKELAERIASDEMIAVVRKSDNKLIGNLYLSKREFETLELGYVFNRRFWHQGYAKESCEALIKKVFEDGIHRIYAECDPSNKSSWRLLESLDFTREAYFKQNVYFWKDEEGNPLWKDTFVYSLLRSR